MRKLTKKQANAIEARVVSFKRYDGSFDGKYAEEEEEIRYPLPCSMLRYDGSFDSIVYENNELPATPEIDWEQCLSPEVIEEAVQGIWLYRRL